AKTMTSIAAVESFATAVVGGIGVVMILVGGRAIITGSMTLGDLVMYLVFTGLLAAPVIQLANIGTQISEAFAGLDRIREIRRQATEGDLDLTRDPLDH